MENDGAAKPELDSEAPKPAAAEETSAATAGEAAAAEEEPSKPPSKIFVGGVSWETQDDEFREYFAKFGTMSDCVLMRDRNTGRSRGFGFVTYVKEESKKAVLSTELTLSGRKLDAKEAVPKGSQQDGESKRANGSTKDVKKIFVGALAQEVTKQEFDEYFKAYGEVTDSVIMIDKHTGRSRGFGFVSYRDASSVEEVLKHNNHEIHNKRVDCKKATPRGENDGGRGGGRGGYSTSSPYDWGGGGGWDNGGRAYDGWGGPSSRGGWSGYGDYGGYGGGGYGYGPRWGPSGGGGPPSDHPYYSNRGPSRYRPY